MPDLTIFGQRLKKLRQDLGLSQRDFASRIGVTASALSSYEKGTMNPSLAVAVNVAAEFGESLDWLCGLSEIDKRKTQDAEIEKTLEYLIAFTDIDVICPKLEFNSASIWINQADINEPLNKLFLIRHQMASLSQNNMMDIDTCNRIFGNEVKSCARELSSMISNHETKDSTPYLRVYGPEE